MKRNVVLVCGGRDFTNRSFIYYRLDKLHKKRPITLIVQGFARGADRIADDWATLRKVESTERKYEITPAMWNKYGRSAGPIRNKQMLNEEPDLVVAFPGGAGTANMITQAEDEGIEVLIMKLKE